MVAGTRFTARVFPFEYKVFFICCADGTEGDVQDRGAHGASNCDTDPSRYRPALCRWDSVNGSQQLVGDIADMRITYDGVVPNLVQSQERRFRELAGTVPTTAAWVTQRGYWSYAQSAQIELLATTADEVRAADAPPTGNAAIDSLGKDLPSDRRLYAAFTTSVALRVRTPWVVAPSWRAAQ